MNKHSTVTNTNNQMMLVNMMRNVTFSFAVLVLVLLLVSSVHAVGPDSVDSVLDEDKGLIDNAVTAIERDDTTWDLYVGTHGGLSVP